MKRILFILSMLVSVAYGQSIGYLRYDSVRMEKVGGNSELILLNGTRNVTGGVLTNLGNGRTGFVTPTGGSGGLSGGNLGAGYRWYVPGSSGIKTAFVGYGQIIDSASNVLGLTFRPDTSVLFPAVRATIPAGGGNFGEADTLFTAARYVNMNDRTFKWKNGSHHLASSDSVGNRLNYSWATNPLDAAVWSSSGTAPTTGGVSTTINGTNTLTSVIKTGVENFTVRFTAISNTKSSVVQSVSVLVKPDTLSATTTRKLTWLLADTSGYINYFRNDGATTPLGSNRGYQQLFWAASDTFDFEFINRARYVLCTMTNRANGQKSYFRYDMNAAVGNVGAIQIITSGNFTFLNNFVYKIDEIYRPDFLGTGNSTMAGSGATIPSARMMNKTFERTSNSFVVHAGGGERAISLLAREEEITEVIRPRYVIIDYGVNDNNGGSIALFSQYMRRFADSLNAEGIGHIWLSLVPQPTNVDTYNDTIQAIATNKGGRYINQTATLRAGSANTNKNTIYMPASDLAHVNDIGQQIEADILFDGLTGLVDYVPPVVADNIPTSNKYAWLIAKDENNQLVAVPGGGDTSYIKNLLYVPGASTAQLANINIDGTMNIGGSGQINGSGTDAAPNFSVASGLVTAANFSAGSGIITVSGGNVNMNSGSLLFPSGTSYIRTTAQTPLRLFVNIVNAMQGTRGIRIGTEGAAPGFSYMPATFEVADSIKARITRNGGMVINDQGHPDATAIFRVEGDADSTLIATDPATDFVGIGTGAPRDKFDVRGVISYPNAPGSLTYDSVAVYEDGRLKSATPAAIVTAGSSSLFGQFTPTLTAIANSSALTAFEGNWQQTGNVVSGSFQLTYTATAPTTLTTIDFTLPVASDLTVSTQLSGQCNDVSSHGNVTGRATDNVGRISFTSPATPGIMTVNFQYRVI